MNNEYLKFGKALFIIVTLFVIVDILIGYTGDWLRNGIPATVSQIGKASASVTTIKADLLIIGSSRAAHHYNSELMQKELGMSVYNAGSDGMGLMYGSCILNRTLKRCTPKIVVLELSDAILVGDYKTSDPLKMYYNDDEYIKNTINSVSGKTTTFKMRVNAYRFNKLFAQFGVAYLSPLDDKSGYEPLPPNTNIKESEVDTHRVSLSDVDTLVLSRLHEIIKWSREYGFMLIIVDSPTLLIFRDNYSFLKELCKKEQIACFDNSNIDYFLRNTRFFRDQTHLNSIGADEYTRFFLKQLRTVMNGLEPKSTPPNIKPY